jgi:predicted nucleic acid-binding protein
VILVDTSIWIDHLRAHDQLLARFLDAGEVLTHPFVIGELALGNLPHRNTVLGALSDLPRATAATEIEILAFIDRHGLAGLGIGYIDVHLLAAARLTDGCTLWTRDKRLNGVADRLGLAETVQ